MTAPRFDTRVERIVLVVLDGLRADAVERFGLEHFAALARSGASTLAGTTVRPSVTACVMASLLTGATPERHGCQSDRFRLPRPRGPLHPVSRVLAAHGFPSAAFLARIPFLMRPVAHRLAAVAGVSHARFHGDGANDVLQAATPHLRTQRRGFLLLHWPDGDRAGHQHGWMSPGYAAAVQVMDRALGRLCRLVESDPATLLIALADHGGGGSVPNNHDAAHPLNCTIPIAMAGHAIVPGDLGPDVSILDIPATILQALGIALPESYSGRPLAHALRSGVEAPASRLSPCGAVAVLAS